MSNSSHNKDGPTGSVPFDGLSLPPESASARWSRHLAMISQVGKMALASLDVDELLSGVVDAIQKAFSFYDASIFLVEFDSNKCVLRASAGMYSGESPVGYRQQVGVGIVGRVAELGETILANDVLKEPRYLAAFEGESAARSELAVPVKLGDKTIGVINVENREPDAFDERDVAALEAIAQQVAQAISNARLYGEARLVSTLNRKIVDSIPSALAVLDADLRILSVNPAFCAEFDRSASALVGRNLASFLSESSLDEMHLREAVEDVIASGKRVNLGDIRFGFEDALEAGWLRDGQRVLNVRVCGAELPEGKRALLIIDNITEWRQAEAKAVTFAEQLDMLMAHTPIGINSIDMDGVYTFWSSGSERIFGYSAEEMVGRRTPGVLMPDVVEVSSLLEQCRQSGTLRTEMVMKRKDDSDVPIEQHWVSLFDRSKRQVGYTVCFQDVSDRRRAQEELLREKLKLDQVVSAIGAGLALVDRDMKITWANRQVCEWFRPDGDVVGRHCYEVYAKRDSVCKGCPAAESFETGELGEFEDAHATADGQFRYFHHSCVPIRDGWGTVAQVLKLSQDVTDHAKKVYQLSRLRQLGEAMQSELELGKLLRRVLTYVTAGQALGFNRAILLLVDREAGFLEGKLGVGPDSGEDASRIWRAMSSDGRTLQDLLHSTGIVPPDSVMMRLARSIRMPLDDASGVVASAVLERSAFIVEDAENDARVPPEFAELLGARQFVVVPLVSRNEAIGAVIADNLYSGQPITSEHVELLSMFAGQAGLAIENAESYDRLRKQMAELTRAYQELEKAQHKLLLNERLTAIGRVAAHVAHEIRNPLVTIGGWARSLYVRPHDAERNTRSAKIIMEEVTRLEKILANVMDFTRPTQPIMREWDIADVIRATLRLIQARAHEAKVAIALKPGNVPKIRIDPEQVKQVLLNLFQNAVEVMPDGGRLTVAAALQNDNVEVHVHNTGPPIEKKHMADLFEPFFTTKPNGTGLGLAVSQKIMHDHGGEIHVKSSEEEGTTFTIAFPRDRAEE